jgi:hypothetical protein
MVLVHPHPAMMGKTGEVSELPPVRMVREGRNGWVEYSYQGQEKLAGFAVVPTPGWGLIFSAQSLSSVMRESDRLKTHHSYIIVVGRRYRGCDWFFYGFRHGQAGKTRFLPLPEKWRQVI